MFTLILFLSSIFAASISQSDAELVARNLFIERSNQTNFSYSEIETISDGNTELYHIFHLMPSGFIIVAGDDRAVPILGYSFENEFSSTGQPTNIQYFMGKFKTSIKDFIDNNIPQTREIQDKWTKYKSSNIERIRTRSVAPLLLSRFDQGTTWNTMCPTDGAGPDGHALVGCVAVSMVQVMHYWKYPEYGSGSNSYYHWDYGNLSANFNTFYDYDNMPNNVGTEATQKLLYHAGVAVEMGYGADGSGAWVVGGNPSAYYALKNNFLFRNDMDYVYPYQYSTSDYREILQEELDNNRPMIYRGYSNDGGHAWNVDGYQGEEFHCNWGWGGYNNGYFPLSTLGGFDSEQAAVIQIQPQSLSGPNVVMNGYSVFETVGDGDAVVNPGEIVDLVFEIENMQPWLDATGIDLILESQSADLTVLNEFIHVNYLASGNQTELSNNPFTIQISDDATLGMHQLTVSVVAESAGNDTFVEIYTVNVEVTLHQAGFPYFTDQTVESSPLALDINDDGIKELFFGDYGGFVHGIDVYGNPLSGFPVELEGTSSKQIWGSLAADDIDGDGEIELVVSCKNKHVYAIDVFGNIEMDFDAGQFLMGTPALADVDGDGLSEIIVAGYTASGDVFVVNHDGSLVDGFPAQINEKVLRGAAVGDLNANDKADIVVATESDDVLIVIYDNGESEIIFDGTEKFKSSPSIAKVNGEFIVFAGSDDDHFYGVSLNGDVILDITTGDKIRTSTAFLTNSNGLTIFTASQDGNLYALDSNGNSREGWPVNTGVSLITDPIIADVDGDGNDDVIVGDNNGQVLAYHSNGELVSGFPIQSGYGFSGSMLADDIDNDGDIDIAMGTNTAISIFDIKQSAMPSTDWSMHRGNIKRTGFYTPESSVILGDLNNDSIINVLDIVQLVNAILDNQSSNEIPAGDLNQDGILNVLDIVNLVNIILDE